MATTPEQLAANRRNATRSTGPVTDSGKAASSRNAVTHGLTCSKVVLPGEDPAEYEELRADTLARLAPEGAFERIQAEAVADALWRYRRVQRHEAAFWQLQINMAHSEAIEAGIPDSDPDLLAATLFADPAHAARVALIHRYLATAERACAKAIAAFEKARKTRPEPAPEQQAQAQQQQPSASRPTAVRLPEPPPVYANKSPDEMTDAEHTAWMDACFDRIGFLSQNPVEDPKAA